MWRSPRFRKIAVIGAVVALVVAVAWELVAIPALVKYPNNLDAKAGYEGIFSAMVNPTDGTLLATPVKMTLTVDRRVQSVKKQTGARRVLVKETIDQHIGGPLLHAVQVNTYVMDRRSLKNVSDPRATAFSASNAVNRAGAYRVNMPFGLKQNGTYRIYENDVNASYPMTSDKARPTEKLQGLKLLRFVGSLGYTPVTPAYLAELNKLMPLPKTLTAQQLSPTLKAAGVDLQGVLAELAPYLSAADRTALIQQLSKPVRLQFVEAVNGSAGIDQQTGAIVDLDAHVFVGARPVAADLAGIDAILNRYPTVAKTTATRNAIQNLDSAKPLGFFEYAYTPTAKSLPGVASKVKSMKKQLTLAQKTLPLGLLALAAIGFVAGAASWVAVRPRRVRAPKPAPAPVPAPMATASAAPGPGPAPAPALAAVPVLTVVPAAAEPVPSDERRGEIRRIGPPERRLSVRRNGDRRVGDRRAGERRAGDRRLADRRAVIIEERRAV